MSCSKCGQDLPVFSKEVERKFKVMCDLWISSLLTKNTVHSMCPEGES